MAFPKAAVAEILPVYLRLDLSAEATDLTCKTQPDHPAEQAVHINFLLAERQQVPDRGIELGFHFRKRTGIGNHRGSFGFKTMLILGFEVTNSMAVKFPLINSVLAWIMKKRFHEIELFMKYPLEVQHEWLMKLVRSAWNTEYGREFGFADIRHYEDYRNRVPVVSYEDMVPQINRLRAGEQNILWPTEIRWFAKSSGTTGQRSKFLPVSQESLDECHFNTGKDMLSIYCNLNPNTRMFTGKSLMMAGSATTPDPTNNSYYGDLSAILVNNLPFWAGFLSTPDNKTALIENFEEKLNKTVGITIRENVTSLTWGAFVDADYLSQSARNHRKKQPA